MLALGYLQRVPDCIQYCTLILVGIHEEGQRFYFSGVKSKAIQVFWTVIDCSGQKCKLKHVLKHLLRDCLDTWQIHVCIFVYIYTAVSHVLRG